MACRTRLHGAQRGEAHGSAPAGSGRTQRHLRRQRLRTARPGAQRRCGCLRPAARIPRGDETHAARTQEAPRCRRQGVLRHRPHQRQALGRPCRPRLDRPPHAPRHPAVGILGQPRRDSHHRRVQRLRFPTSREICSQRECPAGREL